MRYRALLGLITLISCSSIYASFDLTKQYHWLIEPSEAYYHFSSSRDLKNGSGPGVSIGYHFYENSEVDASISSFGANFNHKVPYNKTNGEYYTLGGVYYPWIESSLQPFLALDGGWVHFTKDENGQSLGQAVIDVGAGLIYPIKKYLLLRGEVIDYETLTNGNQNDVALVGGLSVLIGKDDNENNGFQ